jgi:uncharacterized membrane protein
MLTPPPVPAFDHLHPIVVHFPIALLLVAPLFVLLALLWKPQRRVMMVAACVLIVLGAVAAQVAVMTGEESSDITQTSALAEPVLERHEDLAETARTIFLVLAGVAVAGTAAVWKLNTRAKPRLVAAGLLVYAVAHMLGCLVLANAAHEGGRVVHEYGTAAWAKNPPFMQENEEEPD